MMRVDASKYDFRLAHFGAQVSLEINSPKAFEEFAKLTPETIDRDDSIHNIQFSKAFGNTTAVKRTTADFKRTRFIFSKLLGFNHASRHIPIILDVLDKKVKTWKEGQIIDALPEMCDIALRIAVLVVFGKDVNDEIEQFNYTKKNGEVEKMDFYTFLPQLMKDLMHSEFSPFNILFPHCFTYGWFYPNNIDMKNCVELRTKMRTFLDKLDDKNCMYHLLINEYNYTPDEIFDDLIGLLHAAHQTSHHTTCSAIFFLKSRPDWYQKVKEELSVGLSPDDTIEGKHTLNY